MAEAVFEYSHRVTYAECTVGNHLYYGRYLELLEAARGAFFRHLGTPLLDWQGQDTLFPVKECHLRYMAPARYDDQLGISVWITRAFGARLNFGYRIVDQAGRIILDAETLHACTGLNERPRRLPEKLHAALRPFLNESQRG